MTITTASLLVNTYCDVEFRAFITDRVITVDDLDEHGRIDAEGNWTELTSATWGDDILFESDEQALASVADWVRSEGWTIAGPLAFDVPVEVTQ